MGKKIGDVLDTDIEHAYDTVANALTAANWTRRLVKGPDGEEVIEVPEGSGREIALSRGTIISVYHTYDELVNDPPQNFHLLNEPMIGHKVTFMRSKTTNTAAFRRLTREVAYALAVYATEGLPEELISITTPICDMVGTQIAERKPVVVPILRAGYGMVDGICDWLTVARIGQIGMYRHHVTKLPVIYSIKLPGNLNQRTAYICDPMLATGGSAVAAIEIMKSFGCERINLLTILSVAQGVNAVLTAHPDVNIYTAALDEGLTEDAYIVPGLGDAGDRIFGTK